MEDNNKLSYFFLGMGIGVAIGILFAPKSGEETRRIIRERADEGRDYVKKRSDEGRDYVKRRTDEARESASQAVERGREAVSRQRDQLSAAVEAGKQAYRDTVTPSSEAAESEGGGF